MARDNSWNEYDVDIHKYVYEVNQRFAGIAGYQSLEWLVVKAMVWTEVMGGPTTKAWKTRPMQIGNAQDPGWETLTETINQDRNQLAKTRLIATSDLKQQMLTFGRDEPKTNLRAGVYWLCYKAAHIVYAQVDDSLVDRTYSLGRGESPSWIAPRLQTTTPVILHNSKLTSKIHKG